jgi:hypothetical protein
MQLAQASTGPVTVTAYVDRRRNASERRSHHGGGMDDVMLYEQENVQGRLFIGPDNERVMDLWKGKAVLRAYNKPKIGYGPGYILLDIKNVGSTPVQVVDGYLQVFESATDMQPYIELSSGPDSSCFTSRKLDPTFGFSNTGWGRVDDAKLKFGFTSSNGHLEDARQTFTAVLGSFTNRKETTVLPALRELGVDMARIQQGNLACPSKSAVQQCLRQLIDSGAFGSMSANSLRRASNKTEDSASSIIVTTVTGRIDYTWIDSKGRVNQRQSPFAIEIPLTSFKALETGECGAGGPEDIHPKIMLKTDGTNYRLPLEYRTSLAPGQNTRLSLSLGAEKASEHNFQVVLRLSDGSMARSGPIDLLYFKERSN